MPTLWRLHMSRDVRGMVSGPVKSVDAMYAGHLCKETRDLVKPSPDDVRMPSCRVLARHGTGAEGTFGLLTRKATKRCMGGARPMSRSTTRGAAT